MGLILDVAEFLFDTLPRSVAVAIFAALGGLLAWIGFAVRNAFAADVELCNSSGGQLAQFLSEDARVDCGVAGFATKGGAALGWIGIVFACAMLVWLAVLSARSWAVANTSAWALADGADGYDNGELAADKPASRATLGPLPDTGARCESCGRPAPQADARFCSSCGAELPPAIDEATDPVEGVDEAIETFEAGELQRALDLLAGALDRTERAGDEIGLIYLLDAARQMVGHFDHGEAGDFARIASDAEATLRAFQDGSLPARLTRARDRFDEGDRAGALELLYEELAEAPAGEDEDDGLAAWRVFAVAGDMADALGSPEGEPFLHVKTSAERRLDGPSEVVVTPE